MSIAKQIADMSAGRVTEEDVAAAFPKAMTLSIGNDGHYLVNAPGNYGHYFRDRYAMIEAVEKNRNEKKKPVDNRTWHEKVEAAVEKWCSSMKLISSRRTRRSMHFASLVTHVEICEYSIAFYFGFTKTADGFIWEHNKLVDCLHAEGLTGYKKYKQVD